MFPKPRGKFNGEFECDLVMNFGGKVRVSRAFSYFDGQWSWDIPAGFIYDGASFPWWARWLPTYVALAMVGFWEWDGYSAAMVATILQSLIGWPLQEEWRESSAVHDWGYWIGRAKLLCDVALFRAQHLRIYLKLQAGEIGELVAWWKLFRAAVMFFVVVWLGWPAYWGHVIRRKRRHRSG